MSARREFFVNKAATLLELDINSVMVVNLEKGVFNTTVKYCKENSYPLSWSAKEFKKKYSTIARRLLANMDYTTNATQFKSRLINGDIKPHEASEYTREELNPDVWGRLKAETLAKLTVKKEIAEDGMFKCNRCKSMKTVYYQMQTRSADEPMTTYVTCTNCEARWKC
jgi:DNA-directed RNA polymerase subunit M/transcription elongation factor TFIIS